jgi:hypothetical protein
VHAGVALVERYMALDYWRDRCMELERVHLGRDKDKDEEKEGIIRTTTMKLATRLPPVWASLIRRNDSSINSLVHLLSLPYY